MYQIAILTTVALGMVLLAQLDASILLGVMYFAVFTPVLRVEVPLGYVPLGIRTEDLLLVLLVLKVLWNPSPRMRSPLLSRFWSYYALLLAVVAVYTVYALATHPSSEISYYFHQKCLGATAMLLVSSRIIRTPCQLRNAAVGMILGGVSLCVLTVLPGHSVPQANVATSAQYDAETYNIKNRQSQNLVGWNPNTVGMSLGMIAFVTLAAIGRTHSGMSRRLLVGLVCVFLCFLLRSYTRTAILACGCGMAYMTLRAVDFKRLRWGGYLTVIILGLVLVTALGNLRKEAFIFNLRTGTNTGLRNIFWSAGIEAVATQPLGYGVGVGEVGMERIVGFRESAHNDWLDFALNIGVGGAFCALLVVVSLYAALRRVTTIERGTRGSLAAEGLLVFLFISSMAIQVFTFTKPTFAVLSLVVPMIQLTQYATAPKRRQIRAVQEGKWTQRELSSALRLWPYSGARIRTAKNGPRRPQASPVVLGHWNVRHPPSL